MLAETVESRIALSLAFVRAVNEENVTAAEKYQSVYPRLKRVGCGRAALGTSEYKELLDHIIELSQTSINERVEEMKQLRSSLPDFVYQQRKENIVLRLRRLLPGSPSSIQAVRDPSTCEIEESSRHRKSAH